MFQKRELFRLAGCGTDSDVPVSAQLDGSAPILCCCFFCSAISCPTLESGLWADRFDHNDMATVYEGFRRGV